MNMNTSTNSSGPSSSDSPSFDPDALRARYGALQSEVQQIAVNVGREPDSVEILPVTKFIDTEKMRALYDGGVRVFGESRAQELRQKATDMADLDIDWVFIGNLQTNKAGQVARIASQVQSVGSLRLANSLSRTSVAWQENPENPTPENLEILLQVNTSGEETKGGFAPNDVALALSEIQTLPGITVRGFMTMAPHVDDTDVVRSSFRELRKLRDRMVDEYEGALGLPVLSMGMSNDYKIAIEEGATVLRLGTVLFGDRYA